MITVDANPGTSHPSQSSQSTPCKLSLAADSSLGKFPHLSTLLANTNPMPRCQTRLTAILHAVDGETVIWKINVAGLDCSIVQSLQGLH